MIGSNYKLKVNKFLSLLLFSKCHFSDEVIGIRFNDKGHRIKDKRQKTKDKRQRTKDKGQRTRVKELVLR
jgi:hypothetical protein